MSRTLGLIALLLISCSAQNVRTPNDPVRQIPPTIRVEDLKKERPSRGDELARLFIVEVRVSIPMWIDTSQEPSDSWDCDQIQVGAFPLSRDRVLVMQQPDVLCESQDCKIWDMSKAVWQGANCPDSSGPKLHLVHLRDDLFFLTGYMEGPAEMLLIRMNRDAEQTIVFEHITSDVSLAQDGSGIVMESACHPETGKVVGAYSDDAECGSQAWDCGYCARMYAAPVLWYWRPGTPVQRLPAGAKGR